MDVQLDRRMRFVPDPEYKSLYPWAIVEIDDSGTRLGADQIPWGWTIAFRAIEIELSDRITVSDEGAVEGQTPGTLETVQRRLIRAKLRPGDLRNAPIRTRPKFSMFGTEREINEFGLDVLPLPAEDGVEVCTAWGTPGYEYEGRSHNDCVIFYLRIKPSTFTDLAQRIADNTIDDVVLSVGLVSGFYAEWSPDIHTGAVKVLAEGKEQALEMVPGADFEPPRLGTVGEATLYVNAHRMLFPTAATDLVIVDGDETSPPSRLVAASPAPSGLDPAIIKLLRSVHASLRWVIALLAVLTVAVLMTR